MSDHLESLAEEDPRPARSGWAPGPYACRCVHCGKVFAGDKRSVSCADCAYAQKSTQQDVSPFWQSVSELADSVEDIPAERREMSGVRDVARRDQPPAPAGSTTKPPTGEGGR